MWSQGESNPKTQISSKRYRTNGGLSGSTQIFYHITRRKQNPNSYKELGLRGARLQHLLDIYGIAQ